MNLPNAGLAVVTREKIEEYLLNPAHRYGSSKARFFRSFGFTLESWQTLASALKKHAVRHEVAKIMETGYGPRYLIDGELETPDGRSPLVRTVWRAHLDTRTINWEKRRDGSSSEGDMKPSNQGDE